MGTDTIVAVATGGSHAGVGIVRLSGPDAASLAARLAGPMPAPRYAAHRRFNALDGTPIDDGLLLYFAAPNSYTGEDVVELQAHGGRVGLGLLQSALLAAGARAARAGEFTERAYLNGRLDLAQAEAVADLINAANETGLRAARRSLDGELARRIDVLQTGLTELRVHVEGALDFADEDVDWLADQGLHARLASLHRAFGELLADMERGRQLTEGMTVVIAGAPNVGKSTLLNRLAAREAAIVTPIAGTTRDVLSESVLLNGIPVRLLDTAGLRETSDPVEIEGVRRARQAARDADLVCYLVADEQGPQPSDSENLDAFPADLPRLLVHNKCDLSGRPPGLGADGVLRFSAASGAGMEALLQAITGVSAADQAPSFSARQRQVQALTAAQRQLQAAAAGITAGNDAGLAAEELRACQQALAEITGGQSADALLGEIFSRFCIGK